MRKSLQLTAALAACLLPGANASARVWGVDVSSYQGSGINWSSAHSAGVAFAWAKATEGNYFQDSTYAGNMSRGKSSGVYMGAYHFARPDLDSPGTDSGYFWNFANGYIKNDGATFMPMLDFETFNGAVGASSYSAWANAWCNGVKNDGGSANLNLKPVIYMSSGYTCDFNSSIAQWYAWLANYNGENSSTGNPWNVGCQEWGSGVWDIWQYTSSASISGIGTCDEDVANFSGIASMSSAFLVTAKSSWDPMATVSWGPGRLDIFARGTSNGDEHNSYAAGWKGWQDEGGVLIGGPAAASQGVNLLDVFVRGTDNAIWHQTWNGSVWSGFGTLGGQLGSDPASVSWGYGRVDVIAKGRTDDDMWWKYWNGTSWSAWIDIGGNCVGGGAICSWGTNRLDAIVRGTDNAYWHAYSTDGAHWSGWGTLGGGFISNPTATCYQANRIDVYGIGGDKALWHASWNGSVWSGWASCGGSLLGGPGAAAKFSANRVDVFCRGSDGNSVWQYVSTDGSGQNGHWYNPVPNIP